MKPRLADDINVPRQPAVSLSVQIASLRKKDLTLDEIKARIIEIWAEHFKKLDDFWAELPQHIDKGFEKRIKHLEDYNIALLEKDVAISERENRLKDAEADKLTNDVFLRLDELLNKGVPPKLAVKLILAILKLRKL